MDLSSSPDNQKPQRREDDKSPGETFRPDLVARVRREIAEGTYDTPEKWEAALDKLLRRVEGS